jgi:hypothetical protein
MHIVHLLCRISSRASLMPFRLFRSILCGLIFSVSCHPIPSFSAHLMSSSPSQLRSSSCTIFFMTHSSSPPPTLSITLSSSLLTFASTLAIPVANSMNTIGDLVSSTTMCFSTVSSAVAMSSSVIFGVVRLLTGGLVIAAVVGARGVGGVAGMFVNDVVPPFCGRG